MALTLIHWAIVSVYLTSGELELDVELVERGIGMHAYIHRIRAFISSSFLTLLDSAEFIDINRAE